MTVKLRFYLNTGHQFEDATTFPDNDIRAISTKVARSVIDLQLLQIGKHIIRSSEVVCVEIEEVET